MNFGGRPASHVCYDRAVTAKVEDVFEQLGDLFEQFFSFSPDIHHTVELTDDEAARGTSRTLNIARRIHCDACDGRGSRDPSDALACPDCNGSGGSTHAQGFFMVQSTCKRCHGRRRIIASPCATCDGAGTKTEHSTMTVDIPAGVQHEQTIKLTGAGNRFADKTGDLQLYLLVGGRPDSRQSALAQFDTVEPEIPQARIHNANRPLPIIPIVMLGLLLLLLAAVARAS